jgi:hypothetical protein
VPSAGFEPPDPSNSAAADLHLKLNEQPPGSTPSFIRTIKTRKFQWVRHVACAGYASYTNEIVFKECDLKRGDFESIGLGGIINLK